LCESEAIYKERVKAHERTKAKKERKRQQGPRSIFYGPQTTKGGHGQDHIDLHWILLLPVQAHRWCCHKYCFLLLHLLFLLISLDDGMSGVLLSSQSKDFTQQPTLQNAVTCTCQTTNYSSAGRYVPSKVAQSRRLLQIFLAFHANYYTMYLLSVLAA
jgi:hypothetical protein